jgi:hypothetical protein
MTSRVKSADTDNINSTTVTTQLTSKPLKLQIILCHIFAVLSVFFLFPLSLIPVDQHGPNYNAGVSLFLFTWIASSIWYVVIKIRIYWNHG